MLNTSHIATTAAVTAIVAFGIYRRVRRNIGRQTLTARRQIIRVLLIGAVCAVLTFAHPLDPRAVAYMASGLIVGAVIGWFALRHTEFESNPAGYFYIPHLYIGLAITALFVGRILYRMALVYPALSAGSAPMPASDSNPLTLGILYLTASYYVVYCTGLLRWLRAAQQSPGAKLPAGADEGASSTTV